MAAGKPTAVHWFLIVFVMLAVVFGALWYMEFDERTTVEGDLATAETTLQERDNSVRELNDQITQIKQKVGHNSDEVGDLADLDEATLLGQMDADIKTYGQDIVQGEQTMSAVIRKLRAEYDNTMLQSQTRQTQIAAKDAQIATMEQRHQTELTDHIAQVDQISKEKNEIERQKREELDRINAEVDTLRGEKRQLTADLNDLQQEYDAAVEEWTTRESLLLSQLSSLRKAIDEVQDVSFERADGVIRWVDHARGIVWINLGSADDLPVRTGFSVYTKSNHGIGRRSSEDIKGKIEVTNIVDGHLAEARILTEDIYRPIAQGDPIYSPLFTVGRSEKFSFVGLIDFDNDGRSDRDRLHAIVKAAHAQIDNEVDDKGELHGQGLTFETKFLVVGEIPSATDSAVDEQRQAADSIGVQHGKLQKQAQEQGVRIITLGQFLDYIGWTPQRRLWSPGEEMPFRLRSNSPTLRIEEYGGTDATKPVTGGFSQNRRLREYGRRPASR